MNLLAPTRADPAFRADVLAGFRMRPRAIPARWFYDFRGSQLFEHGGGFDYGVLVALLAAAASAEEPLDDRVDRLLDEHGAIHQGRVSVDCPDDRKATVLQELEEDLPETLAGEAVGDVSTVDGFKMTLADGTWVLVRPSGTEPKLRVYAEAGSEERVEELLTAGRDVVEPLV